MYTVFVNVVVVGVSFEMPLTYVCIRVEMSAEKERIEAYVPAVELKCIPHVDNI